MIKKTITIFIILFLSYNILISYVDLNILFQNHWQLNRIIAQEYLYSENTNHKITIVGSSLSFGLIKEMLPENTVNLSFGGQSPFDGLEIIQRKDEKPDVVLLEINTVFISQTEKFIDSIFLPVVFSLRKQIPALQERYQTTCSLEMILFMIKKNLSDFFSRNLKEVKTTTPVNFQIRTGTENKDTGAELSKNSDAKVKSELFDIMLELNMKEYGTLPDKKLMAYQKKKLLDYKNYFNKHGVSIILFEMPVHEKLMHSKRTTYIRNFMYEIFPPDEFHYIHPENVNHLKTTDGVHLDHSGLIEYTQHITSTLNQIIGKQPPY